MNRPDCPGHENLRDYEVCKGPEGRLIFDTEEEAIYPRRWCTAYAKGLKCSLERTGKIPRAKFEGRCKSIMEDLGQSTRRLQSEAVQRNATEEIVHMENSMQTGREPEHLEEMIRRLSLRGTELKLHLQTDEGKEPQEIPYPAYRWLFRKVFSYRWHKDSHINIGELNAFISMLERRATQESKHSSRYLAIVDSMVVRRAVGKGRSPSKPMNRLLRKAACIQLGMDTYPLLAWTISRWNWADAPSRHFDA